MLHVSTYMFMQTRISELFSEIYRSPSSILNPSKFSHYFLFISSMNIFFVWKITKYFCVSTARIIIGSGVRDINLDITFSPLFMTWNLVPVPLDHMATYEIKYTGYFVNN